MILKSEEAYCNKCGKQLDILDLQQGFHIENRLGYGSKYDDDNLELDLCCKCMDELIDSCKIHPTTSND